MHEQEPKPTTGGAGDPTGWDATQLGSASPFATTWPTARSPVVDRQPPVQISQFRIEREIGAGGMGRVYEATDLSLARQVAIKVIRPGLATPAAAERFVLESQTLARFTHPGIAQIFAAGQYEDPASPLERTPYFVMEYVHNARSITDYARIHALDADARVRLFIKVCESIEHAHRHRIIHRDLKPSNIVIADTLGQSIVAEVQPKVIDFGIARHIDRESMHQPATELVGTLEYMSPEQCAGAPLDERSDVYALCVVLYQLLCGSLPYPLVGGGTTQDIVAIIQSGTPIPLFRHNARLAGDLNAVVMRGLAKDPAARYPGVSRLRADLERYLAGEAVEARWESLTYVARRRVRSWIGFHPRASLTASLIAAVILVMTAGFFVIFEATPLDQLFGRLQTRLATNVLLGDAPRHSLLIGIFSNPDLARVDRLTAGKGILHAPGGELAFSQRGTLAALVERLKTAPIESLGFDIAFEARNDSTQPAATRQLATSLAGFTRTFGARPVSITPLTIKDEQQRHAAAISEPLAPWFAPGMGVTGLSWGNMVSQYLVQREVGATPRPTLSLAMLGMRPLAGAHANSDEPETPQDLLCLRQDDPDDHIWIEAFFPGLSLPSGPLRVRCAAVESVRERTGRWNGPVAPPANPAVGLDAGEEVALLFVQIPPRRYFDAATLDVLDLLEMDDATLRTAVEGRHLFVANLEPMTAVDSILPAASTAGADFIELDDGRLVPGVWTHIATLESMLSGQAITRLGASKVVICSIAAAVIGAGCAIRYFRRGVLLATVLCALSCLIIAASQLWFITRLEMLNPLIPALAMLLAAAFCWFGLRAQRPANRRAAAA